MADQRIRAVRATRINVTLIAPYQCGKVPLLADNNTYTLLSMLLLGAGGTMVGIANVGTELYIELFALRRSPDPELSLGE